MAVEAQIVNFVRHAHPIFQVAGYRWGTGNSSYIPTIDQLEDECHRLYNACLRQIYGGSHVTYASCGRITCVVLSGDLEWPRFSLDPVRH